MATPTVDELLREAKQVASREMQPKPTLEEAAGDDDTHRYNLSQWRNERNENRARWLARRCAAAEAKLAKCGGENCIGLRIDGVTTWVTLEAKQKVEADLARLLEAAEVAHTAGGLENLRLVLREIKEKRDAD